MQDGFDAAVVGGGISGLATAFALRRAGQRVVVLEASARLGGAIATYREGEWIVELGPNTVQGGDPVTTLVRDAGLGGELLAAGGDARRRFLWHQDWLCALPTTPGELLRT